MGECSNGFVDTDLLFGNPAVRMFAIERLASDGCLDAFEGIQGRHGPIRTKGQCSAGIQQGSESISAFGPFGADPFFAPAPVIGAMVRLHRSNYFLLAETV